MPPWLIGYAQFSVYTKSYGLRKSHFFDYLTFFEKLLTILKNCTPKSDFSGSIKMGGLKLPCKKDYDQFLWHRKLRFSEKKQVWDFLICFSKFFDFFSKVPSQRLHLGFKQTLFDFNRKYKRLRPNSPIKNIEPSEKLMIWFPLRLIFFRKLHSRVLYQWCNRGNRLWEASVQKRLRLKICMKNVFFGRCRLYV